YGPVHEASSGFLSASAMSFAISARAAACAGSSGGVGGVDGAPCVSGVPGGGAGTVFGSEGDPPLPLHAAIGAAIRKGRRERRRERRGERRCTMAGAHCSSCGQLQ